MHTLSCLLEIATWMAERQCLKLNMPKIEYTGSLQHLLNIVLYTRFSSFLCDTTIYTCSCEAKKMELPSIPPLPLPLHPTHYHISFILFLPKHLLKPPICFHLQLNKPFQLAKNFPYTN